MLVSNEMTACLLLQKLANNQITSLDGLAVSSKQRWRLRSLDIRNNQLNALSQMAVLASCSCLRQLQLDGTGIGAVIHVNFALEPTTCHLTSLNEGGTLQVQVHICVPCQSRRRHWRAR